jgi:arylsulfatase
VSRPHIFFIISDEFRSDALGCMGNTTVKTPHLDELAQDSTIFENAYTNCPMCAPARASLATGRYPLSHGVLDNQMAPVEDEQSLYQTFQDHGYLTTNYGKFHVNRNASQFGFAEVYPPSNESATGSSKQTSARGLTREQRSSSLFKKNEGDISLIIHGHNPNPSEQTVDSLTTNAYIERLDQCVHSTKPIFHRLSIRDPHTPYMPTSPYDQMYDPDQMKLPPNFRHSLADKPITHRYFYKTRGFDRLTEDDYRKSLASYYGLVTHVDDRVGQVLQRLKELNVYDDSIIVFTSDHGSMMGEHGFIEKWGHMYEPVAKIPLMIKFPNSQYSGHRYESFVEIIDIMPTLLDYANIPIPERVQGSSLMPMLTSGGTEHKSEVFSEIFSGAIQREPGLMIRDKKWKLTVYPEQESIEESLYRDHYLSGTDFFDGDLVEGELYDMEQDPYEMNNLFGSMPHADIKADLLNRLERWKSSLGPQADYQVMRKSNNKLHKSKLLQAENWAKVGDLFREESEVTTLRRQSK